MIAILGPSRKALQLLFSLNGGYKGYDTYRYFAPGDEWHMAGWTFTEVMVYGETLLETHEGWHLFVYAMARVKG